MLHKTGAKLKLKQRFPVTLQAEEDQPTLGTSLKEEPPSVDTLAHLNSKNSLSIMVARNRTIHLVKIFEGRITTSYCDVGDFSKIGRVAADFTHSFIIYAMSEATGDIVVMEQKSNNQVKGDAVECKSRHSNDVVYKRL